MFARDTYKKKGCKIFNVKKLGQEFVLANTKKINRTVIYVKPYLKPQLICVYGYGRYIGIEIELNGVKMMVLGVCAPFEGKNKFYEKLLEELSAYSYISWCLLGDWNGVTTPMLDRTSEKQLKMKQGKLPKSFFELMENLVLTYVWKQKWASKRLHFLFR